MRLVVFQRGSSSSSSGGVTASRCVLDWEALAQVLGNRSLWQSISGLLLLPTFLTAPACHLQWGIQLSISGLASSKIQPIQSDGAPHTFLEQLPMPVLLNLPGMLIQTKGCYATADLAEPVNMTSCTCLLQS